MATEKVGVGTREEGIRETDGESPNERKPKGQNSIIAIATAR